MFGLCLTLYLYFADSWTRKFVKPQQCAYLVNQDRINNAEDVLKLETYSILP